MKLEQSAKVILTEGKSEALVTKLEALTKEFVDLILKGEIDNDGINEITGQFNDSLVSARRKFNASKIDPAKKAAAIEKGKATRAADRAASAAMMAQTQAEIVKAKQMEKDGILPEFLRKETGVNTSAIKQYYDFAGQEAGYHDVRSGYDVADYTIYKLKSKFSGEKVGKSVLARLEVGYSEIIGSHNLEKLYT